MADITYTVNQDNPENIAGFEQFSQADTQLVNKFEINSLFVKEKNYIEFHILDLVDTLLESNYNYISYKELGNAQSAGREGASILTINPVQDIEKSGYSTGDVKVLYHFLNDLYTLNNQQVSFFIQEISPDRTEIKLQSLELTNEEVLKFTRQIQNKLTTQSFFSEFRLNFKNNNLIIGVNIDTLTENNNNVVVVKLYEPLPIEFEVKSTLNIVETVADSVAYIIDSSISSTPEILPTLRPANFNLELTDTETIPTGYLSYDELFSYPVNNSNNQIYSLINEKGVELSIDHTSFSNFIHFSSAYERLVNFKYKLGLIENYTINLSEIENISIQSTSTTGSAYYYENLIEGIVGNFDHYERFLYYESSSYSWPKSNTTKPYINIPSSDPTAINWYADQLAIANNYDLTNLNAIINSIPSFLREDLNNANYITFIHMIGQHFDNLWIYGKGVSDKYDADNRLDFGISKDLVGEALKNFGVKLYTSNKSTEDLFSTFIGQGYVSGSEIIDQYITGSITGSNIPIEPSSFDSYQKEINKRIYHNLSYLLKTKGTERGVRALINCFGIPSDILTVKLYGGRNRETTPFFGNSNYSTSSLDKIRLDNTGSEITGNTLSQYTSITKPDYKYTDDLHGVEIGFSPTTNIDNYILSQVQSDFNIDQYIGDPRDLQQSTYQDLNNFSQTLLQDLDRYDVKDFVRLIKFFDNIVFKIVKDFLPARVSKSTGIIIKPHLLSRSKIKTPTQLGAFEYLEGLVEIGQQSGSNGGTFGIQDSYLTSYFEVVQTPQGLQTTNRFLQEQPKFDGQFSGSLIQASNGELNSGNPVKFENLSENIYDIVFISGSDEVCLLGSKSPAPLTKFWVQPGTVQQIGTFFAGPVSTGTVDSFSNTQGFPIQSDIEFPHIFDLTQDTGGPSIQLYQNYDDVTLTITSNNVVDCETSVPLLIATCSLMTRPGQTTTVLVPGNTIHFTGTTGSLFSNQNLQTIQRQVQIGTGSFVNTTGDTYIVPQDIPDGSTITFKVFDTIINSIGATCEAIKSFSTSQTCNLGIVGSSPRQYVTSGTTATITIEDLFNNQPNDVEYLIQFNQDPSQPQGVFINVDNASNTSNNFSGNEYPVEGTAQLILNLLQFDTWSLDIVSSAFPLQPEQYLYNSTFLNYSQFRVVAKSAGNIPGCEQSVVFNKPQTIIKPDNNCNIVCALYNGGSLPLGAPTLISGQYYTFYTWQVFNGVYNQNATNPGTPCIDDDSVYQSCNP
jgi:hypothetical protein